MNLTFKLGATEALVWAVDLPSQTPIANAPITIYDDVGNQIGSGTTDKNGLWKGAVGRAIIRRMPCLARQAMKILRWLPAVGDRASTPGTLVIHNACSRRTLKSICIRIAPSIVPGKQYISGVWHGRHSMDVMNCRPSTPFRLYCGTRMELQLSNLKLQLSPYGTFNGEFKLSQDAVPGYYTSRTALSNFIFHSRSRNIASQRST